MKPDSVLIIFAKNLIYGKVKTRLAATIGHDKALDIYNNLIAYTHAVSHPLPCKKIVYYSNFIEQNDIWSNYLKARQNGDDLGERMCNAFKDAFATGYTKAVIIGTDCFEINTDIISDAFKQLSHYDIVIGPAVDGGYYLLGMKFLHHQLFKNIIWSTDTVFDTTINAIKKLNLSFFLMPVLNDIDEEKDLLHK